MREHNHLYDVSIDMLELSEEIHDFLARYGIVTVGDCIDLYNRGNDAMITVPPGYFEMVDAAKIELRVKSSEHEFDKFLRSNP